MSQFLDRIADIEWTTVVPPGGPSTSAEAEDLRQQALRMQAGQQSSNDSPSITP